MDVFNIVIGVLTIIGLFITICQIKKTLSAAEAAEKASDETKKRVDASFMLPDIAELVQYARFVKQSVRDGCYDVALFRLQDVKDRVSKYEMPLKSDLRLYTKTIEKIDLCIRSLDMGLSRKGNALLEPNQFCMDIEAVIACLNSIQNIVKDKAL